MPVYYHGTRTLDGARRILKSGVLVPPNLANDERGAFVPVSGRVYLAPDTLLWYPLATAMHIYRPGFAIAPETFRKYGRYCAFFQAEAPDVERLTPDEDDIGAAVKASAYIVESHEQGQPIINAGMENVPLGEALIAAPDFARDLLRLARSVLGPKSLEAATKATCMHDEQAQIGKHLLPVLPRPTAERLIALGARVSHQGPLRIVQGWRLDRRRSQKIGFDGGGVFEDAERIA